MGIEKIIIMQLVERSIPDLNNLEKPQIMGWGQGYKNRYSIIDHGHKKSILCIFSKTYKF